METHRQYEPQILAAIDAEGRERIAYVCLEKTNMTLAGVVGVQREPIPRERLATAGVPPERVPWL